MSAAICSRAAAVRRRQVPDLSRAERVIANAGAAALAALIVTGLDRAAATSTDVIPTWICAATALAAAVKGWSMQRVLAVGAVTYAAAWSLMSVLS